MKKLCILLLCLLLTACGETMRPSDAIARVATEGTSLPHDYHVYYSDADPDSPHYPTNGIKEKLYSSGYDIDSLCEDYAVLMGNGTVPYEIHLMRARSHSNISDLLSCLNTRRELLSEHKNSTFNPDTEERVEQAVCYLAGRYAVLLVTADNTAMRALLDGYIK